MNIILIGAPGSGKSTQGNLLSKQLRIPYLSTGHIFRTLSKEKSSKGRYIKELLHAGKLVPDEEAIPIVEEYLNKPEYERGFILDGFPRTVMQAQKFSHEIYKVVFIDLPDKEALWRIAQRIEERDDSAAATILDRIATFHEKTDPVVDYYREKDMLVEIDGSGTVEEVNNDILHSLGKQKVQDHIEQWKTKKKVIMAFTGLCGVGKSTASSYLEEKYDRPIVHFGAVVTEEIKKRNLEMSVESNIKVQKDFREKYGLSYAAKLNQEIVSKALSDSTLIVIDDLHAYEEIDYLQNEFPETDIQVVHIWSPQEKRYTRVSERKERKVCDKVRDMKEVIDGNMGPTMALADYTIVNDSTLDDFHHALDHVYREIYFGS